MGETNMYDDYLDKCLDFMKTIESKYGIKSNLSTVYTQYDEYCEEKISFWVEGIATFYFNEYASLIKQEDKIIQCIQVHARYAECQQELDKCISEIQP